MPRFAFLTLLLALLGSVCPASAQELLPGFSSFTIEAPQKPPPPGEPLYYGATSAAPAWLIAQWAIPGHKLSPYVKMPDGSLVTKNAEANVHISGGTIKISQTGAVLPCTLAGGKPRESDLFFAPTEAHLTPLLTLSEIGSLTQTADITVEGSVLPGASCKVNQGYALLSIVLVNTQSHPAQVFFYQLELSQICHAVPGGQPCYQTFTHPLYFSRTNPYGADEYAPMLGQPFFTDGTKVHFSADLLPRLKAIIKNGPAAMDHNLSHWGIANAYYGQHIWGGVTLSTIWSGVRLTALP